MSHVDAKQAFLTAVQHHEAGQIGEAETLYRQILSQDPSHADALHLLGVLASQLNRHDFAVELVRRAITLRPRFPEAYCNLGNILKNSGQLDAAIAAYRQAIALRADFPDAYSNLGNALFRKGEFEAAIGAYHQAIALCPEHPEAHGNLGNALFEMRKFDQAITACRQAIALQPNFPEACNNLGNALYETGQLDQAIEAYQRAILLRPAYCEAHNNLASALFKNGKLDAGIAACRHAIAINPNYAQAHVNLGNALKDTGRLDDAIVCYRKSVALKEDYPEAHSNLLLALNYHSESTPEFLLEESLLWAKHHAEPLKHLIRPHANDRDPGRCLKVGYVSPDLREHVVGRALLPFLQECDADQFESICYSHAPFSDAMTGRIRAASHQWRDTVGLATDQLAEMIREDQIDILVDLSGHSSGHRLLMFALRPAPVQFTWLGYPNTTGISAVDYRITDPCLDPPDPAAGARDARYVERSIRLPGNAFCYQAATSGPPVNPLPALTTGRVTFGCLNNLCKVTPPTLEAWIQILKAIPSADLLLYAAEGEARRRLTEYFAKGGIEAERIRFVPYGGPRYFEIFHQIDISLDPFPFTGSTTTCDSLWMGVPVITLAGTSVVSRLSLTILASLDLTELAAHGTQEYVKLAIELAKDLPRLSRLRSTLRPRMVDSTLMNAPHFARHMETALRTMWRNWCATV